MNFSSLTGGIHQINATEKMGSSDAYFVIANPLKKRLDININIDTIKNMAGLEDILVQMKNNPANVRFADLSKVCSHYFGIARHKDGSHHVYKTPWQGDPRINIQNHKGKAKSYQVKQVLLAIEKLEVEHATEE